MRSLWKKWVTDMGNRLTGAGMVYRFTLQQIMKSKSNRAVFGILLTLAALTIPVAGLFVGSRGGGEVSSYVEVSTVEEYLNGGRIGFDTRYGIQYGYSIVAMILCVFSVTYIVRSIVEEKVSRLAETLMVSVRPMALVLGKILAVMTFMFTMLLAVLGVFGLSYVISGRLMDVSFVSRLLASMGISMDLLHLGPGAVLVALVSLVLADCFFSLLAGLAGAGCSSMDEIESANMSAMMAILAGYLVSCIGFGLSGGPWTIVMAICPVISAFTVPAFYVFGDIGVGAVAVSWLVELVCVLMLLVLSARVYDQLILYRGSRLKFRKILAMGTGHGITAESAGKRSRKEGTAK